MASVYKTSTLLNNGDYRMVLQTTPHGQVVVMRVMKDEDIPRETHRDVGQFIVLLAGDLRITTYQGDQPKHMKMDPTDTAFIPAGTTHYISTQNGASLLSFYSGPEHPPGTIHATQRDVPMK